MSIAQRLQSIYSELAPFPAQLVAVSKTKSADVIMEAYQAGQKIFGENRVQELVPKYETLPKDIQWHLIGHLQTNKVKYIAPFVSLIHSVDSLKLLKEIHKEAVKNNRVIDCLLEVRIAKEETKYGLAFEAAGELLRSQEVRNLDGVRIRGLMGMATLTDNKEQIRAEFRSLAAFFHQHKNLFAPDQPAILSMGMSGDYFMALGEGSTMIRVGSKIFGERN